IPYSIVALPSQLKVIYGILLMSSFLMTFFRFKQKQSELEEKVRYLAASYEKHNQELREALIYREEVLKDLEKDEVELVDKSVAAYIRQIIYRTFDYLKLNVTKIDLEDLLTEVKRLIKLQGLVPQIIIKK